MIRTVIYTVTAVTPVLPCIENYHLASFYYILAIIFGAIVVSLINAVYIASLSMLSTSSPKIVAQQIGSEEYVHLKSLEDEFEYMESHMPKKAAEEGGAPSDVPPGTAGDCGDDGGGGGGGGRAGMGGHGAGSPFPGDKEQGEGGGRFDRQRYKYAAEGKDAGSPMEGMGGVGGDGGSYAWPPGEDGQGEGCRGGEEGRGSKGGFSWGAGEFSMGATYAHAHGPESAYYHGVAHGDSGARGGGEEEEGGGMGEMEAHMTAEEAEEYRQWRQDQERIREQRRSAGADRGDGIVYDSSDGIGADDFRGPPLLRGRGGGGGTAGPSVELSEEEEALEEQQLYEEMLARQEQADEERRIHAAQQSLRRQKLFDPASPVSSSGNTGGTESSNIPGNRAVGEAAAGSDPAGSPREFSRSFKFRQEDKEPLDDEHFNDEDEFNAESRGDGHKLSPRSTAAAGAESKGESKYEDADID